MDNLSLDNLPQVLRWSELPHGSPWVRRQALQLLREEFSAIAQAPVLLELDKSHLIEALQSDFLQASELEVLQAVLRWGEQQLVRRMEDREPNIVSQTAHSVARKGVRRRDLNDVELRDILSELLPHVRVDHVLPPSHESLAQAIRRGLVSTPPSHMIGGDSHKLSSSGRGALSAWIRGHTAKHNHHTGLYVKPRLFMPYFEETKSLLADQLVQEMELVRHRMVRMSSHIPDTLYMIDDAPAGLEASSQIAASSSSATSDLDVVTGAVPGSSKFASRHFSRCSRSVMSSSSSRFGNAASHDPSREETAVVSAGPASVFPSVGVTSRHQSSDSFASCPRVQSARLDRRRVGIGRLSICGGGGRISAAPNAADPAAGDIRSDLGAEEIEFDSRSRPSSAETDDFTTQSFSKV